MRRSQKLTVLLSTTNTRRGCARRRNNREEESNWTIYAQLVRFFLHFGHHAVILRCDDEPSTVALANSPMKSLRSFGVTCKLELGNHQGNGAAEAIGMCFLQLEELARPTFGAYRPTAWCLVHASWIRNRYATSSGQPA